MRDHGSRQPTEAPEAVEEVRRQGALFAWLWAAAHLVHSWHQGSDGVTESLTDPCLIAVAVAAVWVLWRPSSGRALVGLAVVQIAAFASQAPLVANHWTVLAFGNAGILVSALSRGRPSPSVGAIYPAVKRYLQIVLLISYGAAAVAKLNTGFLSSSESCAVELLRQIGVDVAAVPRLGAATAILTAGIELAIPILLLGRSTRLVGMALAGVFHLALAVTPPVTVMDFSLVVFALLIPFAPSDAATRLLGQARASSILQRAGTMSRGLKMAGGILVTVLVLLFAIGRGPVVGGGPWAGATWGAFVVVGVAVVSLGMATLWTYRGNPGPPREPPTPPAIRTGHVVLLLLLALNAVSPYVGGKTTSSFTMFSNLRTEGGKSNHLFLPRLGLSTMQDDLIRVLGSSNPVLQRHVDLGLLLNYHELRRILRSDPTASVTFERSGQLIEVAPASRVPELVHLPFLSRKMFHFRPVNASGPPVCQP